jgi:hypothetical protein
VAFKEIAATWLGTWAIICLVLVLLVRIMATRTDTRVGWSADRLLLAADRC